MSSITLESLYNSVELVKRNNVALNDRLTAVEEISGVYVSKSDLQTEMNNFEAQITEVTAALQVIETKLQKITLPESTRYYLEESEITAFRENFRQLRSMMAEVEKSRQALIRLAARFNFTNSRA
jgi:predicted  nucleic acid-binding Zn-ribbon protein